MAGVSEKRMIYYTADLHFGHRNVIQYCNRPWATVEEMNEGLVTRWNAVVRPEDTVYVLGDFSMNARDMEIWTPRLNGTKVLVVGNHDRCFRMQSAQVDRYLSAGWAHIIDSTFGKVGTHDVNCHHFPYQYDHPNQPVRYMNKRLPDLGITLLHGHVHTEWLTRCTDSGTLMINVGVDVNNYCPVSEMQIAALIDKQQVVALSNGK